jgi:hypothetical protein
MFNAGWVEAIRPPGGPALERRQLPDPHPLADQTLEFSACESMAKDSAVISAASSVQPDVKHEQMMKTAAAPGSIAYAWPKLAILVATILLGVSTLFSYWALTLHAPQYPDGLKIVLASSSVSGDVREVDGLNHYIGMMPLNDAASFERSIAPYAITLFVIMGLLAVILSTRWAPLLAVPIILFPFVYFVDLYFWLYRAGHNLDPTAALSSSVKPFTPAILGEGIVGQFSTTAMFQAGWFIAVAAAVLAAMGILGLRRRNARATAS